MGPLSEAGFVIPRQTFVPRCHGGNFPRRAVKDEERGPLRPSILTGTSLHPADAKGLAAWLPPLTTAGGRRPCNESRMPPQRPSTAVRVRNGRLLTPNRSQAGPTTLCPGWPLGCGYR